MPRRARVCRRRYARLVQDSRVPRGRLRRLHPGGGRMVIPERHVCSTCTTDDGRRRAGGQRGCRRRLNGCARLTHPQPAVAALTLQPSARPRAPLDACALSASRTPTHVDARAVARPSRSSIGPPARCRAATVSTAPAPTLRADRATKAGGSAGIDSFIAPLPIPAALPRALDSHRRPSSPIATAAECLSADPRGACRFRVDRAWRLRSGDALSTGDDMGARGSL